MRRVAIVTGATGGIGGAFTQALALAGWSVTAVGRDLERLAKLKAGVDPAAVQVVRADVRHPQQVHALFADLAAQRGRVDLLFNNAGVRGPRGHLEDVEPEQWLRTLDTNVSGAFYCIQEAFRLMKSQRPSGGRIINNGSLAAQIPRRFAAAYACSKHAMTGLTRAAAAEGGEFGIACGQIDICNARTPMLEASQKDPDLAEPFIELGPVIDALMCMAKLPLEVNIPLVTVLPTALPALSRG